MSYTLEELARDCRAALEHGPSGAALTEVRDCVSRACADAEFVDTHLGEDNTNPRKLLYEDESLKFCIFAHVYTGAQISKPHDHGPSWAIYGQAVGTTRMTEWNVVEPSGDADPAVEAATVYDMSPGDARVYDVGEVHSPERKAETRLVRVEGINMDGVQRRWFPLP